MVTMYMFFKVRTLRAQGLSARQIARELGIDRKTVNKYLKSNAPPKYSKRTRESREDLFAPFASLAASLFEKEKDLTAAEVFVALREQGYQGSERTVERRVAGIKGERPKERFFEQEYAPAEQAQFDFKESLEIPFVNGVRTIHFHFSTLPYSDIFFIKSYSFKTYEAFMDGVHSFFESIGGMTKNIRFDNLSPCVKKILKGSERLYTTPFLKARDYYDFGLLPCAPARGNEKGDVERDIRTHARRIKNLIKLTGRVFSGHDDLNTWLVDYCMKYRSARMQSLFEDERRHLLPLPPRDEEILCKVDTMTATPYGTVRIGKTTYSVPDALIGASCRVVLGAYDVKIYRAGGRGEQVCVHERKAESDSSMPLEHVLPSLIRKPKAMVRWAHRHLLFPTPVFTRFYERLQRLNPDGAEREYLRTINLIQYTSLSEIEAGMEVALETSSEKLFEDVRDLLLPGGHYPPAAGERKEHLEQIPLSPELSIYDSLIPQLLEVGT